MQRASRVLDLHAPKEQFAPLRVLLFVALEATLSAIDKHLQVGKGLGSQQTWSAFQPQDTGGTQHNQGGDATLSQPARLPRDISQGFRVQEGGPLNRDLDSRLSVCPGYTRFLICEKRCIWHLVASIQILPMKSR